METNSTTELTDENLFGEQLTLFEWYFYVFSGLIGSLLNLTVLFIGLRHTDTHDKPRQLIVINMTFADLVTCLIYMLTRPYLAEFNMLLCYPYYVTIFTSQLCSCLNLLWLNMDKLIYIKLPLHYYTLVSRSRVLILTVISWATLIVMGLFIYAFMTIYNPCNAVSISPMIYLPVCMLYVLMILASFVISAVIYFIAQSSRRMEPQARSRLFQRLFFVFSSTLWTFVTCLPYRLMYLTHAFCPPCQTEFFADLTSIFFRILVLGIVINPLITIITQRLYRQCVVVYFHRCMLLFTSTFCGVSGNEGTSLAAKLSNRRQSRSKTAASVSSCRANHIVRMPNAVRHTSSNSSAKDSINAVRLPALERTLMTTLIENGLVESKIIVSEESKE
ncbi:G-protein coupled receptor aex-2 [Ditylenchus destructor]|uniref:G-protein coupled receptor aex-2 n=1 Tax=Ditylenchus destructor TaxID=166010 RepID=A0AAD4MX23_9BILA|nr:G-protein coupled receptor aex-2 [Ditylenchus destructor]